MSPAIPPLVTTVPERCRMCFTCVRECPAKAIRISSGQAEVVQSRCIGCGHCVRVCSQHAKRYMDSIPEADRLLATRKDVHLCLAPSFAAEFTDVTPERLVGMIRRLGFAGVHEVAFGADLVADRYRRLLDGTAGRKCIGTTCPAVVEYVERYAPHLVGSLATVVSPMVAMARCLRRLLGPTTRIVFAGPCIAKKKEAASAARGEIDAVLTFQELRRMLADAGIGPDDSRDSDFDPPRGALGGLFSVSRGLLEAAGIREDLLEGEAVAVDGRATFAEVIHEFEAGAVDASLLEVLACEGCVMGPGMTSRALLFSRRAAVSRYVRRRMAAFDRGRWQADMACFAELDLSRTFEPDDQRLPGPSRVELTDILARMGKRTPQDELNCGACGYDTCIEHAIAIFKGLAESEMCLPYTIDKLRQAVSDLDVSNKQLASTQEALMQAEKLASMGQLAAGIAHEVNNPLGVVLMNTHLLLEDCTPGSPMVEDLAVIAEQADRCKRIVAGLLNFARQNQVSLQPCSLCELIEHAVRIVPIPAGVTVHIACEPSGGEAELDRDQMAQVLTNLIGNACDAMPEGGELTVRASGDPDRVRLQVADTGTGIPPENMGRIFTPFFTTKPMGKGTGLGLAVTYGIVKMHRGDIRAESNSDPSRGPTGTTFTVTLPRHGARE